MSASAIRSESATSRADLARAVAVETFGRVGVNESQGDADDAFAIGDVGRGEIVVEYAGVPNGRVREAFLRCFTRLAALGYCLTLFTSPRRMQLHVRHDD